MYLESMRSIKKHLKQNLLHLGGYSVARSIYARLEHRDLAQRVNRFLKTGQLALPDRVILEPSLRCNLRCIMCYQDRSSFEDFSELSVERWMSFFEGAPFLKKVSLIGGEIFIRRDLLALVRHLNSRHDLVLSTNGTLLKADDIEALRACNRIFTICLSLDGPQELHDDIRRIGGSYAKTVRVIKELAPVLPVTVNCVILAENLGELPEFIEFCAGMGVKKIKLEFERLYAKAILQQTRNMLGLKADELPLTASTSERRYSVQSLRHTLRECRKRSRRAGLHLQFDPYFLLDRLDECYTNTLRSTRRYLCKNFRTASIAPNGDVIHCRKIRKSFGNILNAPFENIWNGDAAGSYRQELLRNDLSPVCENCPSLVPFG